MIIHPAAYSTTTDAMRIEIPVTWESGGDLFPDVLWFSLPAQYHGAITHTAHGAAAALLLSAMHQREDLYIEGNVSATFFSGLQKIRDLFHRWRPEWYGYIEISAAKVSEQSTETPASGVLFPFSGGADSFYCLYTHLPERTVAKEDAVTHALFVHGFDIPLTDVATFDTACAAYEKLLQECGVSFIPIATNLRRFLEPPDWDAGAVMAVCATGLMFEDIAGAFYYPEINTYDYAAADQKVQLHDSYFFENPVVRLLSSDRMRIENRGGAVSKIDKIAAIAHWPPVFGNLRVCWERPDGVRNCGACSKCLLTMSALELEGALPLHPNFSVPLSRAAIRKSRFAVDRSYFPETWIQYARAKGRRDTAFDYHYALFMSRLRHTFQSIVKSIV